MRIVFFALCLFGMAHSAERIIRNEFECSSAPVGMQRDCAAATQMHGIFKFEDTTLVEPENESVEASKPQVYDTATTVSIRGADTTITKTISRRPDVRKIERPLSSIAGSTQGIAIILGLQLVLGIVTLVVVATKM